MKQLRSLRMSLQSARSNLKKILQGPTVFCKLLPMKIQVNCMVFNSLIKIL